jgi:hypothetical protein
MLFIYPNLKLPICVGSGAELRFKIWGGQIKNNNKKKKIRGPKLKKKIRGKIYLLIFFFEFFFSQAWGSSAPVWAYLICINV